MRLWTCRSIAAATALAAGVTVATGANGADGDRAAVCDNKPVYMVAVRFPCLAHARAFWYSKTYQEDIVPMRDGAGDYTVIVMPAAELPPYMAGRVGPADYVETFGPEPAAGIAQVAKVAKVPEFAEAPNE